MTSTAATVAETAVRHSRRPEPVWRSILDPFAAPSRARPGGTCRRRIGATALPGILAALNLCCQHMTSATLPTVRGNRSPLTRSCPVPSPAADRADTWSVLRRDGVALVVAHPATGLPWVA